MNKSQIKSQTTQILYREPTQAEMRPSFKASVIATLQNLSLIAIVATAFSFTVLRGCADDVERQQVQAIKIQTTMSNSGESK